MLFKFLDNLNMINDDIQKYLVASLKQDNDDYSNIINANHPYPCGICQKNVSSNQKAIECTKCMHWIHIKCNGTTNDEYNNIIDINNSLTETEIDNNKWLCNKCLISNMAKNFPFGLESNYELQNILNTDSLKTLDNLPNYDIISKASDIETLKQFDIDENTISNINSRYYPTYEFQSLKREKSFNIFHTNLNGLENKFEQLHNFINTTNLNLDIIGVSETSLKENENFDLNVNIDGYQQPYSLGSKTSKGGVTIYAKENLSVRERDDLNTVDSSFEAVWIEIENVKSKNIVCGCLYRHPQTDIDECKMYISKCLTKITKEKKNATYLGILT